MKLITRFELASLPKSELRGLYRKVFNDLAGSRPGSAERLNTLASLENISAEIAIRDLQP